MHDVVKIGGLWAPEAESAKLSTYSLFEGRLDLDVSKIALAIKMCASKRVALDIGAHIGAGTVYLAEHFGLVHAFEPMAPTLKALKLNVADCDNVMVHENAVSDRAEALTFEFVPKSSQLSRCIAEGGAKAFGSGKIVTDVKSVSIDDLGLVDVDFIKLDVEGLETRVVNGAMDTIRGSRPVILIEQGGNDQKYMGEPANAASLLLEQAGMVRVEGLPYKHDRIYRFE